MDHQNTWFGTPDNMDLGRETFYQEYLAPKGTVVKPYYWLTMDQSCTKCPYHIRTGEEARVSYKEFHKAFGFPYGPMCDPNNHLIFYELRHFSGQLIQKGHATSCTEYDIHPESMLFEMGSYLDSMISNYKNSNYIILYSNYSPCNEAEHGCISKIYNFLTKYPDITLCIYFSQLYHTDEDFPVSPWNCEALRSLASMWPRVSLSPLCGSLWHNLLSNFVAIMPWGPFYQPILPVRALADRQNSNRLKSITGMKFPFMTTSPQPIPGPNLQQYYFSSSHSQIPLHMMTGRLPPLLMLPPHSTPSMNISRPPLKQPFYPTLAVRHLKMPDEIFQEVESLSDSKQEIRSNGNNF
ncbi:putative C-_U-editing enzyme APOBEC-4 [Sphaerodactylus townsendi]|uniref:putative C->U-editing enzyme APOBEC-4 n=1 Tax=Sphaerodactylus townsendi TaxID=933632 RepID=UPI0020264D06|nr:putative C->U-editing enzyme APOBEC-4 [Sphaerodactylus townsendi]